MRRNLCFHNGWLFVLAILFASALLCAQQPDSYRITPNKVTLRIGEQRAFRMVDQTGRAQTKVTWTVSDAGAFQSIQGDDLMLLARQAGSYRLTARTDFAVAEGEVTVVDGSTLPNGTVQWASGAGEGCSNVKIVPAARTPNGPDFFQQTRCRDGDYVSAYRSDGVQLWRRKIGDSPVGLPYDPGGDKYATAGNRLDPHLSSVCDVVSVGMEQQKARELLSERNESFAESTEAGASGPRMWLIEEPNAQCKIWFGPNLAVERKQKVFVTGEGTNAAASGTGPAVSGMTQVPTVDAKVASQSANTAKEQAPAAKAKHIITNDDIKPSASSGFGGIFYTSSGMINDCNSMCFDQLRPAGQSGREESLHWRQEVLKQIDLVRSDSEWQAYLHQLYDAHSKICQITLDQQQELRTAGYSRDLGPREIAIDEKYDQKSKDANNELSALVGQQMAHLTKFRDRPYAYSFGAMQMMRMHGGFCSASRVIYAQ